MGADQNRQAVVRLWDALNRHDLDAVDEFYTDDDVVIHLGSEAYGWAQLKAMDQAIMEALPDVQFDLREVVAQGDMVAVRVEVTATHEGIIPAGVFSPDALLGTGRPLRFEEGIFYRCDADSRIVEEWVFIDMLDVLQQLGALPEDAAV